MVNNLCILVVFVNGQLVLLMSSSGEMTDTVRASGSCTAKGNFQQRRTAGFGGG